MGSEPNAEPVEAEDILLDDIEVCRCRDSSTVDQCILLPRYRQNPRALSVLKGLLAELMIQGAN